MMYTNRRLNKRRQLTSLFLLVFLFFSAVGHAHTIDATNFSIDQQDCHLCHHYLDKVPEKINLAANDVGTFIEVVALPFVISTSQSYYLSPQLRAPPLNF